MPQHQAEVVIHALGQDAWRTVVIAGTKDRFVHVVDVTADYPGVAIRARLVAEQVQLVRQFGRQVVADKAEIVLLGADAARRVDAVALDDVFPDREAEVVGIDGQRQLLLVAIRPHHVGMGAQRLQIQVRRQEVRFAQQARVPVRGPAFVHDLAGVHRKEIVGLLAHREENVPFPIPQFRRMAGDEPQQVLLRIRRHLAPHRRGRAGHRLARQC
ncbi:conserved hypothetical protein, partial [Ricinus communis]